MVKYRIELDTVRRYRSKNEYHNMQRATCGEHVVTGYGFVVRMLCKRIAENNGDLEGIVEVYRGDTPCFKAMPLKQWVRKA